jgi:hypothetical protein
MHDVADVHDTPDRTPPIDVAGLGVGWIVQESPFHHSASGAALPCPTAMQALTAGQDTPDREPLATPDGLAVIAQLWPSQSSARGAPLSIPTAMQAVLDVQDTPER